MNDYMPILDGIIKLLAEAYRLKAFYALLDAAVFFFSGLLIIGSGWVIMRYQRRTHCDDDVSMDIVFVMICIGIGLALSGFIGLMIPSYWAAYHYPLEYLIAEKLF